MKLNMLDIINLPEVNYFLSVHFEKNADKDFFIYYCYMLTLFIIDYKWRRGSLSYQ